MTGGTFEVQRSGDGDFAGHGVDGKQTVGIVGERIGNVVTLVFVDGKSGNANSVANPGMFGDIIGGIVHIAYGADSDLNRVRIAALVVIAIIVRIGGLRRLVGGGVRHGDDEVDRAGL